MRPSAHRYLVLLPLLSLALAACRTGIPKDALALTPESMARRQLQTRRYETKDEKRILSACAALVQDLGFNIDETESRLGLVVASKERSAVETGQVIGSILSAALTGTSTPIDKVQKMRACIVTRPGGRSGESILVRVTFQRIVWNSAGDISKREGLFEEEHYQGFFEKLSKAVFLEAHEL